MAIEQAEDSPGTQNKPSQGVAWTWHPPLPLKGIPVFVWPIQPWPAIKFLFSYAYMTSFLIPFSVLAIVSWEFLQPPLTESVNLEFGWIALMFLRNLALTFLVAGGLHLYFYTFGLQGDDRKMNPADPTERDERFLGGYQVWDNMFWCCVFGVPLWTVYEAGFIWAYANDWLPVYLNWMDYPILFIGTLVLVPFWSSVHFHFVHKLLHWQPLYKIAHAVHHRNENVGPWSGFSMHPIELVLYFSSVLIHVVLLSHPIHILYHNLFNTLGASTTHSGYEAITVRGKPVFGLTSFHHMLHHRYYNCNYGNALVPVDEWVGSYHDGTPQSWSAILKRRRASQRRKPATV